MTAPRRALLSGLAYAFGVMVVGMALPIWTGWTHIGRYQWEGLDGPFWKVFLSVPDEEPGMFLPLHGRDLILTGGLVSAAMLAGTIIGRFGARRVQPDGAEDYAEVRGA